MKILIVDDEEDIRDTIAFAFESEVDADFFFASTGNEAIDQITNNKDIALIICDYNMPDGTGGDVYKFLLNNNISIPYVLCSTSHEADLKEYKDKSTYLGQILKPLLFDGSLEMLHKYEESIKVNEPDKLSTVVRNTSKYSMVSLSMLRIIQIIPCDVYIKLNNDKFVKVHSKGDQISDEDIHNYNKKKIPKLIIEKEDVKHFLNSVCNKISSMLLEDKKTVKEEKILDVHAFIMDAASSIGFNDQLIRATSKSVEYAVDVFKKNEKYKDVFQHIFGHKGKYLTRHSIALAYISCGIISKLPWNSDETRRKLVLASFLHDAFVKRSEFDEGEFEDGQPESIDSFYGQPQETIKILNKMHDIPMDVDRIILEHLEKPDGSGKRQLTASQLHPLSCVFILSHEIVDHIFHLEFHKQDITDEKIKELIKKDSYNSGHFKKCYESFQSQAMFKS